MNTILTNWRGGLIVSCQAAPGSPLAKPEIIAALAETAEQNGAVGLRIDSPENICAVKGRVKIPVLGIYKVVVDSSDVYITPTLDAAEQIIKAGSDVIAIDGTDRPRPNGEKFKDIVSRVRETHDCPIMADIAEFGEGMRAAEVAGVDILSTTLSGYTSTTKHLTAPAFDLLKALAKNSSIPVVCEGRLRHPDDVKRAFDCGAFAVVVGGAITGIDQLVQLFVGATPRGSVLVESAK
ncbi:MAG: N-acetylmannosamine-6-phosphate 2-epimerase [Acidobacteriota bacterium]